VKLSRKGQNSVTRFSSGVEAGGTLKHVPYRTQTAVPPPSERLTTSECGRTVSAAAPSREVPDIDRSISMGCRDRRPSSFPATVFAVRSAAACRADFFLPLLGFPSRSIVDGFDMSG
jgi:hypothetical protein